MFPEQFPPPANCYWIIGPFINYLSNSIGEVSSLDLKRTSSTDSAAHNISFLGGWHPHYSLCLLQALSPPRFHPQTGLSEKSSPPTWKWKRRTRRTAMPNTASSHCALLHIFSFFGHFFSYSEMETMSSSNASK